MTFNTGNPIGSTDARDLSDNAENFDRAIGTLEATWTDRLGVTRDTFEGALSKLSFYRVGTFAAGYTLTNMRQTLEYNGHEYSWAGTFPKVVAAGATPATSGGIGAGAWVDRSAETGELRSIARSLNVLDSAVVSSTDTTTVLDNVLYIYDANAQVIWGVPSGIGTGEVIVSVSGYTLVTTVGNYELYNPLYEKGDFRRYNGSATPGFDNSTAINSAHADVGFCLLNVSGQVEIHKSLDPLVRLQGLIGAVTELVCVGSNSGDYFITHPENIKDIVISGSDGALNGVNWSNSTSSLFCGWTVATNVIIKGFENVAANINNVFALAWDNVRITRNGAKGSDDAIQITPLDEDGDNGYFTTMYWRNVYINQNKSGGLKVLPALKSPLFIWDGVVIEENCLLSGTRQAYISRVDPFKITSLYLEKGSVTGLILDNIAGSADSVYLNSNTNVAIEFIGTTAKFQFSNVKTTGSGSNTITAAGGSLHSLSFNDSTVRFTGGVLPDIARLELDNTTANGTLYSRYLGGTLARTQLNSTSKLRRMDARLLTIPSKTIAAGSSVSLGEVSFGFGMVYTVATATLKSFQPDITLRVTPATTGSQDYFNVFAYNSSASSITLTSDECYVQLNRWDFS